MEKRNSIIIVVVCLLVLLGVGGKYYMGERKKEQEKELIEIERQSIVILKQTFSDIKEVIIEKTGHNKATGSYRMFVEVISNNGKSAKFTYSFWKERGEIGSYGIVNTEVQKEGITDAKIKVIYSDGKEGEI